jgi:hypothetical protein
MSENIDFYHKIAHTKIGFAAKDANFFKWIFI